MAQSVGTRIAAARRAAGLSRREVAQRLGVHLSQVARWEDGAADPGSMVAEIAALTGTPLSRLVDAAPDARPELDVLGTRLAEVFEREALLTRGEREIEERAAAVAHIEARAAALDARETSLHEKEDELARLAEDVAAATAQRDARAHELEAAQGRLDRAQAALAAREQALDGRERALDVREAKVGLRETKLDAGEGRLARATARVEQQAERLRERRSAAAAVKRELTARRRELALCEEQAAARLAEIQKLQRALEKEWSRQGVSGALRRTKPRPD